MADQPQAVEPGYTLESADTYYANVVYAAVSKEDVVFSFGLSNDRDDRGRVRVSNQVVMSMPHFQRFVAMVNAIKEKVGIEAASERQNA